MSYDLHSPWRKSAIMPIWSFQLTLLSVDLIIAAFLLCIIDNTPAQTVRVGGKSITMTSGTQEYVLPFLHDLPCPANPADSQYPTSTSASPRTVLTTTQLECSKSCSRSHVSYFDMHWNRALCLSRPLAFDIHGFSAYESCYLDNRSDIGYCRHQLGLGEGTME